MKFETYLLLAILIFGIFKTHRSVRRSQSSEERFFAIRMSAFSWVIGILLLAAFVFLPNRPRILLLLPAFLIIMSLVKFWKSGQTRIRQAREEQVNLDRMKRVN